MGRGSSWLAADCRRGRRLAKAKEEYGKERKKKKGKKIINSI